MAQNGFTVLRVPSWARIKAAAHLHKTQRGIMSLYTVTVPVWKRLSRRRRKRFLSGEKQLVHWRRHLTVFTLCRSTVTNPDSTTQTYSNKNRVA